VESPSVVVDYDPSWEQAFQGLSAHLQSALSADIEIEHVGSTAVVGLAAKPILDVDVVVPVEALVAPTIAALATLGYQHKGDLGIVGREAFTVLDGFQHHHLYLVVSGSEAHRDHIDLRDYLRLHPEQAAAYGREKRKHEHVLATDREAYVAGKGPFVRALLAQSRMRVKEPCAALWCTAG